MDEIEIALSSYSDDEELVIEEDEAVPNDYRIDDEVDFSDQEGDSISLEEEPQESLIDEDESVLSIPEEESAKEDETPIDKIEDEIKIDSNEVLEEEEKEEHPNRLKVVRVTPIEEDSFENNFVREEDEYMVNDFEDTDYISFNDLIEGGKSHEDQGD